MSVLEVDRCTNIYVKLFGAVGVQLKNVLRQIVFVDEVVRIRRRLDINLHPGHLMVGTNPNNIYRKLHILHPKGVMAGVVKSKEHALIGFDTWPVAKPFL